MRKEKKLSCFFEPKTVAVIGASNQTGSAGYFIMENFVAGKFHGKVFPVNPNHKQIFGLKSFSSVLKIKEEIDLAVICTPAKTVPGIFRECGEKRIPATIIISAGFNETGNNALTLELKKEIKRYPNTRCIGPNCLGVLNSFTGVDTLFLPEYRLERPQKGSVSFISQSGALGSAILDWASMQGYGISKFVSYGNALDVDESDLIEYLARDKQTRVIAVYLEGVKNGRKFFETAKKYGCKKPIIVLKGGTTKAGSKAALSHTASLAGSSKVFKALFKQTALIEARHLLELFDYARTFARLPKPKGKRIQIITDGGGYGILTADSIELNGMKLAEMSPESIEKIKAKMPSYAIIKNPMDLTGDATNERYETAIQQALLDEKVDMVIVIILYQVPTLNSSIVPTIAKLNRKKIKPLIVISVGGSYSDLHKRALEKEGVINFSYPNEAVKSLKVLHEFYSKKKKHEKN